MDDFLEQQYSPSYWSKRFDDKNAVLDHHISFAVRGILHLPF